MVRRRNVEWVHIEEEGRMEMASAVQHGAPRECRSLEALEREIAELSAHIDAATCRLLLAVAEFDRREGWAELGFRSCAHWLGWRVGLDLATARERLRVGRALEKLPRIRAAFGAGEVSYSKVRAMSRVATPETEEELLEVARHGTALHLERLTRLFRSCSRAEEEERARRLHAQRYLQTWTDEDGMLCLRGRLPPEVGAVVKQALEAALRGLGARENAGANKAETQPDEATAQGAVGVATPDVSAETSLGSDPRIRPMLEVAPEEREQRAADALGLVAEWALAAADTRQASAGERHGWPENSGREGRFEVVLQVDAEVLSADAPVGRCEIEGGPRLPGETVRRLCCSSPVITLLHGKEGELLGPGRRTRCVSGPLWRALRSRDPICVWPGCTARRDLVVHHVEHWAHGGETRLENLTCLCRSHHWAVHEGAFRVRGRAPDELTFFTPEGHELPASPVPLAADPATLPRENRKLGLTIGPETGLTHWQGEAMDYSWAVESLMQQNRRAGWTSGLARQSAGMARALRAALNARSARHASSDPGEWRATGNGERERGNPERGTGNRQRATGDVAADKAAIEQGRVLAGQWPDSDM
jgi:hypothetical protein